jgi:hypothetical protein
MVAIVYALIAAGLLDVLVVAALALGLLIGVAGLLVLLRERGKDS